MGYGAGALVMSPIAARRILSVGVAQTFVEFGIVYLIIVVLTAQSYVNPPEGWRPAGWEPATAVARAATTRDYTVREAMSTWRFWLLWIMLFLSVSAGIMIISQASPMAQQIVGLTAVAASGIVGVISIFNALGRVFWAWVSDSFGRANTYLTIYAIYIAMFSCCRTPPARRHLPPASPSSAFAMGEASALCLPSRPISSGRGVKSRM